MGKLEGKVAIVTGASRGIGRAISHLFAKEGAQVAVLVRSKASGDKLVEDIKSAGGTAACVVCDVGDSARIPLAVAEVIKHFGKLDVLVNNAFDISTGSGSVAETPRATIEAQLNTGFFAALGFMQACYPHLERTQGRVVNVASSVGIKATPGYLPYAVSKEAIRVMTRMAAREWGAKNVRVNVLNPIALTDATRQAMGEDNPAPLPEMALPRMGSPEKDIAPVALFLASDDSAYLTGYTLNADGGFLIDACR